MDAAEHSVPVAVPARAAPDDALRRAREFLAAHRLDRLPDAVRRFGDLCSACERCVADGDRAAAAALYAPLAAFAAGPGDGVWSAAVAHYLGLLAASLARWEAAAAHFEDALRLAARGG